MRIPYDNKSHKRHIRAARRNKLARRIDWARPDHDPVRTALADHAALIERAARHSANPDSGAGRIWVSL